MFLHMMHTVFSARGDNEENGKCIFASKMNEMGELCVEERGRNILKGGIFSR